MKRLLLAEDKQRLRACYTQRQTAGAHVLDMAEFMAMPTAFREVQYLFSTWGPPQFTTEELADYLPNLEARF